MLALKSLIAKRKAASKAGFTLMEILIVLAIIATLVAIIAPNVMRQFDKSKATTTGVQINALKGAVDQLKLEIGRVPTDDEGLGLLVADSGDGAAGWAGPYIDELPNDGWGRPFLYISDAGNGQPDIYSLGADGVEGGTGNDADLHSNPYAQTAAQ